MSSDICEECGHDPVQCHAAFDRVRELEAELLEAHAELAHWRGPHMEMFPCPRAEKAEARVAELETALRKANTSAYNEAVARRHAREREAE